MMIKVAGDPSEPSSTVSITSFISVAGLLFRWLDRAIWPLVIADRRRRISGAL